MIFAYLKKANCFLNIQSKGEMMKKLLIFLYAILFVFVIANSALANILVYEDFNCFICDDDNPPNGWELTSDKWSDMNEYVNDGPWGLGGESLHLVGPHTDAYKTFTATTKVYLEYYIKTGPSHDSQSEGPHVRLGSANGEATIVGVDGTQVALLDGEQGWYQNLSLGVEANTWYGFGIRYDAVSGESEIWVINTKYTNKTSIISMYGLYDVTPDFARTHWHDYGKAIGYVDNVHVGTSGTNWTDSYIDQLIISGTPVHEPATMLLLSSGLIGLVGFRRKFKK